MIHEFLNYTATFQQNVEIIVGRTPTVLCFGASGAACVAEADVVKGRPLSKAAHTYTFSLFVKAHGAL